MGFSTDVWHALDAKYTAKQLEAKTNLENLLERPTGIGEHGCLVEEIDKWFKQYDDASSRLDRLNNMKACIFDT